MTAAYMIVTPIVGGTTAFAVVADNTTCEYVFSPGHEIEGLDTDRVENAAQLLGINPISPEEWLAVAVSNMTYFQSGEVVPAGTIDAARSAAHAALASQNDTSVMSDARAQHLIDQAEAYSQWAEQYPEAADGADDPEADLALAQLTTPPVDPEKPHKWLPIATTETDCGFCEKPAEDAIHNTA